MSVGGFDTARLVFLHPIGLDRDCWQWLGITESALLHVFPGHGSRAPIRGDVTLDLFADDLAEQLTAGPADVVGVSMGGAVALHLALRHPAKVRSLVVACTNALEDQDLLLRRADAENGSEELVDTTLRRWFTAKALEADTPQVEYARRRLAANDPAAIATAWRALARHDVLDRLAAIQAPTTVIGALQDLSVSMAEVEQLTARLPTSRLVSIDGPHMVMLECPREFTQEVDSHLQWVARLSNRS